MGELEWVKGAAIKHIYVLVMMMMKEVRIPDSVRREKRLIFATKKTI